MLYSVPQRRRPTPAEAGGVATTETSWSRADWLIVAALVGGAIGAFCWRGGVGVIPGDTGALAHAAERVLKGQLPHRDFDDPYSGLLSIVNGLSFALLGTHVLSFRIVFMAICVAFTAGLYAVLRQAVGRAAATGSVIGAFLWSFPNYPSPMPTWYNLMFTTLGAWFLSRYARHDRLRDVAWAGACGGVSILFKIVGLYFFAAAGLYFIFRAQRRSADGRSLATSPVWSVVVQCGLAGTAGAVVWLISASPAVPEFLAFAGPTLLLAGHLAWNEWRLRRVDGRARLASVVKETGVFVAGALLPVALFLAPYAWSGAVGQWVFGVFIAPQTRLGADVMGRPISPAAFWPAVILAALGAAVTVLGTRLRNTLIAASALTAVGLFLLVQGADARVYVVVWECLRLAPTLFAGGMIYVLAAVVGDRRRLEPAFIWIATTALFSLVQFPLTHGIYFLYVAPLVVIAGAHLFAVSIEISTAAPPVRRRPMQFGHAKTIATCLLSFVILYAGTWVFGANPTLYGVRYRWCNWNTRLLINRARIRFDPLTAFVYNSLIREVRSRTPEGSAILALPDSPEVYYFTGRRNPTRTLYDAFDKDYGRHRRDARLIELIDEEDIKVVVLREWGGVSQEAVSPELFAELLRRFPHIIKIGTKRQTVFSVLYRDEMDEPAAAASPGGRERSTADVSFAEDGETHARGM